MRKTVAMISGNVRLWATLILGSVLLSWLFAALHIPAAPLFAGMVTGILVNFGGRLIYSPHLPRIAQIILGVAIGMLFSDKAFSAIDGHLLVVLLVTFGTLVLSLLSGLIFSRLTKISRTTGLLSMTSGGASGITAMAHELDADLPLVAIVQYLRVVLVMATLPAIVMFAFHGSVKTPAAAPTPSLGWSAWGYTLLFLGFCGLSGAWLARILHMAAPYLLGPLIISLLLTISNTSALRTLPVSIIEMAYLLIGWQAGLQLSIRRIRSQIRLIPIALGLIVVINLLCAILGYVLARLVGVSNLDGYLATAPGALYAALAISIAAHGNVLFVLGVHLIRLLMMLLIIPPLARFAAVKPSNGDPPETVERKAKYSHKE